MKVLHAKGMMRTMQGVFIQLGITIFCLLFYMRIFQIITIVGIILLIYLSGICPCIKIYCTHWIKYGNGRVVIKGARKDYVNGKPAGRWKNVSEEFMLENLDSCGMSLPVLGEYIEFNPFKWKKTGKECVFQLKNGKKLGFEIKYYVPEDMDELFRYIYKETGIKFQDSYVLAEESKRENAVI